jgi:tellurite resistance protein TerC
MLAALFAYRFTAFVGLVCLAGLAVPGLALAIPAAGEINPDHFPPLTVALFLGIFVFSLIMDLIQHKGQHDVSIKNAAGWSVFWIAVSLGFWRFIDWQHGPEWASMFLTGYVLEKTLSIDNLMVFIAIFRFFGIESGLQHRILYYGILGAIIFRAVFVAIGSTFLIWAGPYAEVLFGAFVAWAGIQMLRGKEDEEQAEPHFDDMLLVRWAQRFYPVFPRLVGHRFFVGPQEVQAELAKEDNAPLTKARDQLKAGVVRWMTPAMVCLLVVEGSDVLFAVDSVPAVIAVTKEPLLVYTAMIFAVLGLRSLYFILVVLTKYLVHLEKAVIAVLFFIAAKMFLGAAGHWVTDLPHLSPALSMYIVLGILGLGVAASLVWPAKSDEGDSAGF